MNFIEQFDCVINHPSVRSRIFKLLKEGSKHKLFINYFGVNFNDKDIVSVKFYFSFFETPSAEIIDTIGLSEHQLSKINLYWTPSKTYDYLHQGLTIALKCYLDNGSVNINNYIHFRSEKLPFTPSHHINLSEEDKKQYSGICFEKHGDLYENKNYYYVSFDDTKRLLLEDFGLNQKLSSKLSLIEYTESNLERKLNLIFTSTEDIKKYFQELNNSKIDELNAYFYNKHNLYYFAPGLRYNNKTKAIYYVPKETFYTQYELKTIEKLIKKD